MDELVATTTPVPFPGAQDLLLFGDLTIAFEEDLQNLLHIRSNSILQAYFHHVSFSIRDEISTLPAYEQERFPRFTDLIDLVAAVNGRQGNPAIRFALLCVYQLARVIHAFSDGEELFPTPERTHLLGLCTGSFAAAAMATSSTVVELKSIAVEAVRVALRTGIHSTKLRDMVEQPSDGIALQSWSYVVAIPEVEAMTLLNSFIAAKGLSATSIPYISAVGPSSVTISGPPTVLKHFLLTHELKSCPLPIESPYHAAHLFGEYDAEHIVGTICEVSVTAKKQIFPIVSCASGTIVSGKDLRSLLRQAVIETLRLPIAWDQFLPACVQAIRRSSLDGVQRCTIWPVASSAATLLSSMLAASGTLQVAVCHALSAPENSSSKDTPSHRFGDSKIAITGFSGRFPDAASNDELWELLRAGRDTHGTIPKDRFDWEAHFDPTGKKKNTSRVKYGCFINEPGLFDARFFNISPREAENTDPAQRLALMTAYEALEMGGFVADRTPSSQRDRVGVFYGVTSDDWREVNSGQDIDTYFIPGGNRAFVPGRISYFFRFSGPSISVDTACSSSFAAIQSACSYLWQGNCDTAVAGGVNILTNPDNFAGLDRGHFLSTTGNCNPFDNDASGYCRADAAGSVVLKRLEDAIADNDPIFGVIVGADTNHCGQTVSITRPHEGDQLSLFNRIIRHTNTNPLEVSYVEMHGTGTQAGDAAEMQSVLKAFVPSGRRHVKYPLHLGAVKANIGHSESASGVSALIKVLKMMQHSEIPPHIGIKTKINVNYPVDLAARNVKIANEVTSWRREDCPSGKRTCFLNNFSAAGGNTAILLEDAPLAYKPSRAVDDHRSTHAVAISAKTSKSLVKNIHTVVSFLERKPESSIAALSYTTTARRVHHKYRAMVTGSDIASVVSSLGQLLKSPTTKPIPAKPAKIAWAFTGQGSLYVGIGGQFFNSFSLFRSKLILFDHMAKCQGLPGFLHLICTPATELQLDQIDTITSHLALTCVQMALVCLWTSWGLTPTAVIGHSLGEYAALYAAGVLAPCDVIYLVGTRARLLTMHCVTETHAMLAVGSPANVIGPFIDGSQCEIACLNSGTSTVISGPRPDIETCANRCRSQGHECTLLNIPYAFHSAQVDPILEAFESAARSVVFHAPTIPYISPLLAVPISESGTITANYLTKACRGVVNFQAALRNSVEAGLIDRSTIWLEIGSHPTCCGMVKGVLGLDVTALPSMRKRTDAWTTITESILVLYMQGIDINWNEFHRDFQLDIGVLPLPSYEWDLNNYWIQYKNNFTLTKGDDPISMATQTSQSQSSLPDMLPTYECVSASLHRVLKEHISVDAATLLVETNVQDQRLRTVIQGHQVNGVALCPSSLYADMALTISQRMLLSNGTWGDQVGLDCGTMKVDKPLIAKTDNTSQLLHVAATADWINNKIALSFFSVDHKLRKTVDHASCIVKITQGQEWASEWKRTAYLIQSRIDLLSVGVGAGESHHLKRSLVYKLFANFVDYSPSYQGMQEVVLNGDALEATAQVKFQVDDAGFQTNPCWIDSCGHIAGFIMNGVNESAKDMVFVNHGWDAMRCAKRLEYGETYRTYNRMQSVSGTLYSGDTYIFHGDEIIAMFEGVKFQGMPRRMIDMVLPRPGKSPTTSGPAKALAAQPKKPIMVHDRLRRDSLSPRARPSQTATEGRCPPNNIVSRLLDMVLEETGIDAAELDLDVDLADLGIDSLLTLNISGRLEDELGLGVSLTGCATLTDILARVNVTGIPTPPLSVKQSSANSECASSTEVDLGPSHKQDDKPVIMETVRSIVMRETGAAMEELSSHTNLAELGVDSLLSLTILSTLGETLGMELPPTLLADNSTLAEIESTLINKGYIEATQQHGLLDHFDQLIPARHKHRSGLPSMIQASQRQSAEPLRNYALQPPHATSVRLQGSSSSAKNILFLFPDGAGSATSYASLPDISLDLVVYGLNCPWMRNPENLTCTLERYAAKMVVEVRRRQPKGPYHFGGWSAGGILAYEAAQQLAEAGESTAHLILLDSPDPIGLQNPPARMYDFLEGQDLFGLGGKAPPAWLRPHMSAFIRMLDGYNIAPFRGIRPQTRMIYARDGLCKNSNDPRPEAQADDPREMLWLLNNRTDFTGGGWGVLLGRESLKIDVVEDANHYTILMGTAAHKVSCLMRDACM